MWSANNSLSQTAKITSGLQIEERKLPNQVGGSRLSDQMSSQHSDENQ